MTICNFLIYTVQTFLAYSFLILIPPSSLLNLHSCLSLTSFTTYAIPSFSELLKVSDLAVTWLPPYLILSISHMCKLVKVIKPSQALIFSLT